MNRNIKLSQKKVLIFLVCTFIIDVKQEKQSEHTGLDQEKKVCYTVVG